METDSGYIEVTWDYQKGWKVRPFPKKEYDIEKEARCFSTVLVMTGSDGEYRRVCQPSEADAAKEDIMETAHLHYKQRVRFDEAQLAENMAKLDEVEKQMKLLGIRP